MKLLVYLIIKICYNKCNKKKRGFKMNIQTINYLLKDENNKGLKLHLTNGEEIKISLIDHKLSKDNILSIIKPNTMLINLDYVIKIVPLTSAKATMPIIK